MKKVHYGLHFEESETTERSKKILSSLDDDQLEINFQRECF